MTDAEIKALAISAGFPEWWLDSSEDYKMLGRFAEAAAANERESRIAAQVENESLKAALARAGMEMRKAVLAEREACAELAEDAICSCCWSNDQVIAGEHIAAEIRARGAA